MIYFNFLNFFAFVLEFSISRRVGIERNDSFHFLIFFKPILAWIEYITVFFEFFCYFFGIFCYASGWNETERYSIYSLFLSIFQPILTWNEAIVVFFNFLNFFFIFLEFSITCRVRTERNGMTVFIFSPSIRFPTNFGLKWSNNGIV